MCPLFHHRRETTAAVALNPNAPPFNYVPLHYFRTTPPPERRFQPYSPSCNFFRSSPQEHPPSLGVSHPMYCNQAPYCSTYYYPSLTFIDPPTKSSGLAGSHRVPPPHVSHSSASPIDMKKGLEVGRPQFTRKKRWVPIQRFACGVGGRNKPIVRSLEFEESWSRGERRTTVMIRNIPNKLSRAALMEMLDGHCAAQNNVAQGFDVVSAYDFLYLPIDLKNRCNNGYAFVNFTTPVAARRLYQSLKDYNWEFCGSSKITHICYARIQGKDALIQNFTKSLFECNTDDFLPVVLSPPRDDISSLPALVVITGEMKFNVDMIY